MVKDIVIAGPLFAVLSHERRAAYIRQWMIGGGILVISAVIIGITLLGGGNPSRAMLVVVILLGVQFIYALVRGETIWQLRHKELQYRSASGTSNTAELLAFADHLKKGQQ